MKAIDRLIIKAKRKRGTNLKLHSGIIYRSEKQPEKWVAQGNLWNGVPYNKPGIKVDNVTYVCNSKEEAEKALQELGEKHPNNKDTVIFVDDIE